ncbi:hypothetical protein ACFPVY_06680 [Flavobacterium qiangtangense]|uniref:Uncharacterized protein n=1 Tax=Flavobacterium qiangtangense TaxID=1442595 RepID=A0ABW1PM81_9FLAO
MKNIQTHLDNSSDKKYYEHIISKLTDEQKEEFESLVIRLDNSGAKNPLQWASSEVREKIPQFGRFLVLKSLFDIAKSTKDNISMADDFDEDFNEKYTEIENILGQEKLSDFLKSYSKGIIYSVIGLLDEGNINSDRDKISWTLMKTDENFETTGQIISGLHEDFLEFEDEIK